MTVRTICKLHCKHVVPAVPLRYISQSRRILYRHQLLHSTLYTTPYRTPSTNAATANKYRTHYCNQVNDTLVNKQVTVAGFVQHNRMLNNDLYFGVLRDSTCTVQITWSHNDSDANSAKLRQQLQSLTNESSISVTGIVQLRPQHQQRTDSVTGRIELHIQSIYIANIATELPLKLDSSFSIHNDELRLQCRYLDLRRHSMQYILQLRHTILQQVRQYFNNHNYIDIDTPTLFKSTPEGADEYIVPTKQYNKFYALPQSPQQYKQLLIASGIDKYYQIAKCYRDEGSRNDRQPEFTQIDIECAWITANDIIQSVENMLQIVLARTNMFIRSKQHNAGNWTELDNMVYEKQFRRITYNDAMNLYGSDKPDTRYDMMLFDITAIVQQYNKQFNAQHVIKLFNAKQLNNVLTRKDIDTLQNTAKSINSNGVALIRAESSDINTWKCNAFKDILLQPDIAKYIQRILQVDSGDMLIVAIGDLYSVNKLLSHMRSYCAQILQQHKYLRLRAAHLKFNWIVEFPLFEIDSTIYSTLYGADDSTVYNISDIKLKSTHHPFTAVIDTQLDTLNALLDQLLDYTGQRKQTITARQLKQLLALQSQSYDITCNGVELGGGSIRIHNAQLQTRILHLLGADINTFSHLLTALSHGTPIHGGAAIGVERLTALLGSTMYEQLEIKSTATTGTSLSLRDVMAFPKTTGGNDLMIQSPSSISNEILQQYHIQLLPHQDKQSTIHIDHISKAA